MKSALLLSRHVLIAALLILSPCGAAGADSPELAEARAQLLEAFQRGATDDDVGVKKLRAKIAALEYIASAPASTPAPPPKVINVDFPGGPFSALVALVNKDGAGYNVVGETRDLAIELPPLSLRNADAASLTTALGGLLQQRGYYLGGVSRPQPGQSPVFVLRKFAPNELAQHSLTQFQSFQLAPYLEHQSVDDIVGAIRAAWELDPANNKDALRIKFHPPTGILLVSGPHQGINTVQFVLKELQRTPRGSPQLLTPATAAEKK